MIQLEPITHKQNKPFGCGLYAIAHAVNLNNFITPERLEASKKSGDVVGRLSRYMDEDGHSFHIDALYYDHFGGKLPEEHTFYRPDGGDANFLPVLMAVGSSKKSLRHMIGGKIDREGNLYLYDSLKTHVYKTTLKEINETYNVIYGLYLFMDLEGNYAFI